jgi:DNA-binding Xre family transcriptional regulator
MDTSNKTSPIGHTSQEAASSRYERDERYREVHDRLAPYRAIARAVINGRIDKKLTQVDLADMLETTDSAISRIESGQHPIKLETLQKLGTALGIAFVVGASDVAQVAAASPRTVAVPAAALVPATPHKSTPRRSTVSTSPMGGHVQSAMFATSGRSKSGRRAE